jgi:hypothetical protein
MTRNQKDFTPDLSTQLKDAGLIAASAAAEVDSSAQIIDLGAGRVDLRAIVDVSAIEIASNDEIYDIVLQVSNSATFASGIKNVGQLNLAATEVADGGAADATVGRHELHGCNEVNGTVYRYARLYTVVAGTIATGINYTAWLAKQE